MGRREGGVVVGGAEEARLRSAKRAYRSAAEEGNRQEEARWANVIGDMLKNRGEYVEALKWLRVDFDVSSRFLNPTSLLATCQSLGEVYLRLYQLHDALVYQNKHLELAKDTNDLVEQQRASTQLGRTYHEMFLKSNDDHYSVRNAKKYFKSAMNLAKTLKENPPSGCTSFVKEYIDAYNNIGMLEIDLDNFEEAEKMLKIGLEICDEEEIYEDDDGRTRLHHNLGKVYLELRQWENARKHIEKDINICNRIGHCQGEAKGYINLGELHYRVQKCDEAICCYEKALKLAKSMEDEDSLVDQIRQNIKIMKEAKRVLDEMKLEEQNLKKLTRSMPNARGTDRERKCLMQQYKCLDLLIEKSRTISAWSQLRSYASQKKQVATDLCDKEKLSDSLLVLGESYQKLRNLSEALQLYKKSLEISKSIGNLEGQALAKINIGNVMDSEGHWQDALNAFKEGYRIAKQANLSSIQLDALENMHYSYMLRFDNVEEARTTQLLIDKLKQSMSREDEAPNINKNCCPETDTEDDDQETSGSEMSSSNNTINTDTGLGKLQTSEEDNEDIPIISLKHAKKSTSKLKDSHSPLNSGKKSQAFPEKMAQPTGSKQESLSRKRVRVILSDDEEGEAHEEEMSSKRRYIEALREGVATSGEAKSMDNNASCAGEFQDVSVNASKSATRSCTPINVEESVCSHMSTSSEICAAINNPAFYVNGAKPHELSSPSNHFCRGQCGLMLLNIDEKFVHLDPRSCIIDGKLSVECMKIEAAYLYYLQLPEKKRSEGLFPIIQQMRCGERVLDTLEEVDNLNNHLCGKGWIDVSIGGWVEKRVMKLYIDCCDELSQSPNMKILKKLYISQVSEDEVIVSDCDLRDESVAPLLNALKVHKSVMVLDLSHNSLGNGTLEKLQKVLASGQRLGGFVLDLHQNLLSPSSLLQICECPVLFSRLEVLNVSGNRLTDVSGYFFSSILENCKALRSLNVERCSVTSITIETIADSLRPDSVLRHIAIGYNSPVSDSSIISLLEKLSTLKRFRDLNLSGLKLENPVVNSLCQLTKSSCLSTLMLEDASLETEGVLQLTQSFDANHQKTGISMISSLVELNLGGNPIMLEGGNGMVSLLKNPKCRLKVLVLGNCQLGILGVVQILQALSENHFLEELNIAQNIIIDTYQRLACATSSKLPLSEEVEAKTDSDNIEVADSEDCPIAVEPAVDDCVNSSQSNITNQEIPFVRELSTAIGMAKHLKLLDLSNNGLSEEITEVLYNAWSTFLRADLSQRHIMEKIIHFSVHGHKCCGVKPCCRKY